MSLKIRNHGVLNALFTLSAEGFTKTNSPDVAGTNPPYGVIGGSLAAISDTTSYEAVPADGTKHCIGFFLNNAEGAPFENAPAVASNKVTILRGDAAIETNIYEPVTFALGEKLYSSENGYLTNVESANKQVIGVCTKVPTAADPLLGLEVLI